MIGVENADYIIISGNIKQILHQDEFYRSLSLKSGALLSLLRKACTIQAKAAMWAMTRAPMIMSE